MRKRPSQGSAHKYRLLKQERVTRLMNKPVAEDEPLFDVELPSGAVFKCRRPSLSEFVDAGMIPNTLVAKMTESIGKSKEEQEAIVRALPPQELQKLIYFESSMVKFVCVDPKLVEHPTKDNELGYDEVTGADYEALFMWAVEGGAEQAKGLATFPAKR